MVQSAACYDDALAEAAEGGQSVSLTFDHLDLVDHALGVVICRGFVEVGERLSAPLANAVGEGVEGGDLRALDGGEEVVEAALGRRGLRRARNATCV